jgi:methionyl-tRNA formyltransferase
MKQYNNVSIVFFGSTSDSVIVLEAIRAFSTMKQLNNAAIVSVVTQPPTPIGRKQIITPTPVEEWAKKHDIPVLSFATHAEKPWLYENEDDVINALSTWKPDILISACYGQKIPSQNIKEAEFGGLNVHPSLLPRWRGADPVPWALLSGDKQTGVTVVTLSDEFDKGRIIARKKISITDKEFSDPLRTTLFSLGADLLISSLPDYLSGKNKGEPQKKENETYARKLTRRDGFIPWEHLQAAMENPTTIEQLNNVAIIEQLQKQKVLLDNNVSVANVIMRMLRALSPWPGVWTTINPTNPTNNQIRQIEKRLKILAAHTDHENLILDTVQLEGKNPVQWVEFKKAYLQ